MAKSVTNLYRINHQGGVKSTQNVSLFGIFHMPYNVSIFNFMYVVLKITFILIVIHTGLLWSVETSPELSDK